MLQAPGMEVSLVRRNVSLLPLPAAPTQMTQPITGGVWITKSLCIG